MKKTIALFLLVLGINVAYSQGKRISINSLEPIDTVQEEFFYRFKDKDSSTAELKKHIIKMLSQLEKDRQVVSLDTTDLTSFNLYKTKFSDCPNTPIILVSGFNTYLLSLSQALLIVDLTQIGENTPALYNVKTGEGNFIKSQSVIKSCDNVKTIKTYYRINKNNAKRVVKQETLHFEINSNGNIKLK